MRALVVGFTLAFLGLSAAPRAARADIFFPPVSDNIDRSTLVWFYGCADVPAGACLTIGIGRVSSGYYDGEYGEQQAIKTPFGVIYYLTDGFSWSLADGTCSGSWNELHFPPDSCFAQNIQFERLRVRIDYQIPPSPLPNISFVVLTAIPEPASIGLVATGLLAIGGTWMSRRRPSKSAA
jgi:hypothetical protein